MFLRRKRQREKNPTHKLWGEEYLSDGEWQRLEITRGNYNHCQDVKDSSTAQYRDMTIYKIK